MRSIAARLTPKERTALALIHDTEGYRALIKLTKHMRDNAARQCLIAQDFDQVKYLQGQELALRELARLSKEVYDSEQKI